MSGNSLNTAVDGEVIPASDINQFKTAMAEDIIPRNTSGIATASAGDLGSSTYPFKDLNISGGITSGNGQFLPVGGVIQTIFPAAVTGYLLANGDTIGDIGSGATHESATLYEALFLLCINYFGNAGTELWANGDTVLLPDLRGHFIRGWDNSRGVDSGRAINSTQTAQMGAHNHQWHQNKVNNNGGGFFNSAGSSIHTSTIIGTASSRDVSSDDALFDVVHTTGSNYTPNSASDLYTTNVTAGGSESRPTNTALNYLIKY